MTPRGSSVATIAVTLLASCGGGAAPGHDAGDAGDAPAPDVPALDAGGQGDAGADAAAPGSYSLPEFPGGNAFYIRLPPMFAPFLPLFGDEATREPPGFYEPTSEYLFSYGFIWWLTGAPDLSTAALRSHIREYYVGLCKTTSTVVTLDGPTAGPPDAGPLVARRDGTLEVGTCFNNTVGTATIEVSTYDCPDHEAVIVLVSPQPQSSQVWTELRAIRDGFMCW
jgi:hypothetical protein